MLSVLVINAGSSSVKLSYFDFAADSGDPKEPEWTGHIAWTGSGLSKRSVQCKGHHIVEDEFKGDFDSAVRETIATLWSTECGVVKGAEQIDAVGHRVVHGGGKYSTSVLLSDEVMGDIEKFGELAPLHQAENIKGIKIAQALFAGAREVIVFDTAFHQQMPESSKVYAGPYSWYDELSIRRFGFHGINHAYCAKRAADLMGKQVQFLRIITCHLGNGASLAAIKNGISLMTTMGYTPLEGLVMGTRSGSIDPGLLLELIIKGKYSAEELHNVLNHESGLKGISGLSSDMREIEQQALAGHGRCELALEMFIKSLTASISSLIPVLGGLDALVFTGGIGENSTMVRARAAEQLAFLGIGIDQLKNEQLSGDGDISSAHATIPTIVIKAREELAIAQECLKHIREQSVAEHQM